ncbi:DUF5683 domain-containing protein [Chryseobacterium salipaludis]|uniref:DUF5683 domain-containing protein n=1 Tax=Chryseobacterium TaxID=59732 RepID=UPI001FF3AD76|nr:MULTISPECIES: DUF5683 domain-containing protein [Chryseobacterium]MCJ8498108.1 DUF5683 domain-containing protein [Chryseobacterium salipaludis]MCX3296693.1 DUF5683 domain-containing protein [Planobacterium sp. JC490]
MKILTAVLLFLSAYLVAQISPKDTIRVENYPTDSVSTVKEAGDVQVLADIQAANAPAKTLQFNPTKAGLYSAVLPGLGQYYNRKYWKIPIVWGAIGTGVGVTIYNQRQYDRYRNAFLAELNGQEHEFSSVPGITKQALGRAQDRVKRQRDYAIAVTALIYVLNIVDAVVDAHLYEGRQDPDLALSPAVIQDELSGKQAVAVGVRYRF